MRRRRHIGSRLPLRAAGRWTWPRGHRGAGPWSGSPAPESARSHGAEPTACPFLLSPLSCLSQKGRLRPREAQEPPGHVGPAPGRHWPPAGKGHPGSCWGGGRGFCVGRVVGGGGGSDFTSWRQLLRHRQGRPGRVPPAEGPRGGPGRPAPRRILGGFSRGTSATRCLGSRVAAWVGSRPPPLGKSSVGPRGGGGGGAGAQKAEDKDMGTMSPLSPPQPGSGQAAWGGARGLMVAGSGAQPGGDPSLSPQKPPPAWRELRPPHQDSRGNGGGHPEDGATNGSTAAVWGWRGAGRSRCLRLQPPPAPSRRRLGAPGGRKRLRAAGHVPCCWPRVRPAEGARGAGRVIGRAQPTGRGTGSPQPRGDPGKTGGSWGWVARGPLGALLRGRWPRAPSAFPAPWQGPGSQGGGPGWAGQGGLSLSQGRGDPVSGNAGPLPPPRLTCTEARPLLAGSASTSCLWDTRVHTRPSPAPRLGHSAGRRSPTPDELTLRR